jgi:hypothetical protein
LYPIWTARAHYRDAFAVIEIVLKNERYMQDWVGPLRRFLVGSKSAPVAAIDEQTLDRILAQVGQKFVPADLDRIALQTAIAQAIDTKDKINKSRPGKHSRVLKKSLTRIREAAEVLHACLKENDDAWKRISGLLPSISEDVMRIICAAQAIDQTLAESDELTMSQYSMRIPTANEWLAGVELPLIFEEFFRRKEGRSRIDGQPAGPTVRFVGAVMTKIGISFAQESIVRAMTGLAELRERRRAVRKRGDS